jgi:outer membrane receptor for ferrienterochelin and colicins
VKSLYLRLISQIAIIILTVSLAPSEGLTQTSDLSEEESVFFTEIPSIYTASKHEQKVTEAPSSVSIVTSDEIQKYGYRTLADVLRSVRGIFTTNDRNYYYLGIRGFARPGDYNTRVLVLVDGVRLNDNVFDTGSIGTELILDVDIIDRVEIIRGPSSSLYGTNAFFGVINIITKRGRDLQDTEASGSIGSLDTYRGRFSYGDKFLNGMEVFLSGSYYDSQGNEQLYYKEFDDPETNNGLVELADAEAFYSFFGKLSFENFTLEGGHVERDKHVPTSSYETVFNDPRTVTTDAQSFVSLKYDRTFSNQQNVVARLTYNRYYYDGSYIFDYSEEDEPYYVVNMDYSKGDWMTGELQYGMSLLEKHRVVLGTEYRYNYRQNQGNYDVEGVYLEDERDSQLWGLYINEEFQVIDQLILSAGVRYDYFDTFGGTTNPRVAVILNPLERTAVKFLYGTAFRAPNAYELYYHDGEFTMKSSDDLEPEVIDTYEFIVEKYIGDHLFGTINGFFYQIDDLITLVTDPADDLLVFKNVDEVQAMGVEFGLEGRMDPGVEGRISYAFIETENTETGEILTNSPKHLAKLNLIVPVVKEKLFSAAELHYTSKRKTKTGNYVDDYFMTNLNLYTQLFENRVRISAGVFNLFDEAYMDPASEEHLQESILQDGRVYQLKVTFTF